MIEKLFKLIENRTTIRTELLAGLTTFMSMAYVLSVNPIILSSTGMPRGGVMIATALSAFIGTVLMAALTNYPFVLATGMGLNAYFAYTVCGELDYSWKFALLAVFVEGLIFLALSLTKIREGIFNAIPYTLKKASSVGIGFFIVFLALKCAGLLVSDDATYVKMVSFAKAPFETMGIQALLAFVGLLVTAFLMAQKIHSAILLGILITWALGIVSELCGIYVPAPDGGKYLSVIPDFTHYFSQIGRSFSEFGTISGALFDAWSWKRICSVDFFVVMFAFFFVDLFETLGTLIGVSIKGGFLTKEGRLPRISGALYADSLATSVGALLGTSTTTTYVESASGVMVGGRTGLTAVFAALFFLCSIALAPIFLAIPSFATAPALLIVGFLMIGAITEIDFADITEGLPAFCTIFAMPFFNSVSDGIMWGVISYTVINTACLKFSRVHWIMYVLSVVFILKYALM